MCLKMLPFYLDFSLAGYKIEGWKSIFDYFKGTVPLVSLVSSVAVEKPEVSLISDPFHEPLLSLLLLESYRSLSLSLIFTMMCFSVNLFSSIVWVPGEPFQPVNSFNPSVLEHFLTLYY